MIVVSVDRVTLIQWVRSWLFLIYLVAVTGAGAETVRYSDAFKERYPERGEIVSLDGKSVEPVVRVHNDSRDRTLLIQRTRGSHYGYEKQLGLLRVEGTGLESGRVISMRGFRTLEASWITRKLVLIRIGLGPVAVVEAIYDVEADAWIYRESLEYLN